MEETMNEWLQNETTRIHFFIFKIEGEGAED